jgi:hypothetical protein
MIYDLYYVLTCFQDDSETESLKSEVSELCLLKQKLDYQVSQLQTKVETYERDIECFEVVSSLISLGSEGIQSSQGRETVRDYQLCEKWF